MSEDINPSDYTSLTLEQLRDKMARKSEGHKHAPTEKQKENLRRHVEKMREEIPNKPQTVDEAISRLFGVQQFTAPKNLPQPELNYNDSKRLFWEILKYLRKDQEIIIEPLNTAIYIGLLKWFICDPSCEYDLRKSIYLHGGVGKGKTFLIRALMKTTEAMKFDFRMFEMASCKNIVYSLQETKDAATIRKYFTGRWAYDDLGHEDKEIRLYGNNMPVMEEILVNQYEQWTRNGIQAVITSNLSPDQVKAVYGMRLWSRMNEQYNFIELKGKDKRIN